MSRIDDLIAELCPDGVPRQPLDQLVAYEQPGKYLVSSTDYSDENPTPVLTAGQTFVLGYTEETDGLYPASASSPVVIFDDFTTAFKWVDFAFKAKSSAMKMLTARDERIAGLRYIYYSMQTIRYSPQDHARQWIGRYSEFTVPVPPIEVQREIVRILDTFMDLEAELEAELGARRRQYGHYLNTLFRFTGDPEVPRLPMGAVGTFIRGRRFTKADYADEGIPCIHYGEIYTNYGTSASHVMSHLDPSLGTALRFAKTGDVILVDVGETVEDVGKAVAWLGDEDVAIHDHCFAYRHELIPSFVSYYLQTDEFHRAKAKHVARTKVKTLLIDGLSRELIPVPSPDEQERIVNALDSFDALVSDLSTGLPAELAARRKQYEHYRDKLFTFKERVA